MLLGGEAVVANNLCSHCWAAAAAAAAAWAKGCTMCNLPWIQALAWALARPANPLIVRLIKVLCAEIFLDSFRSFLFFCCVRKARIGNFSIWRQLFCWGLETASGWVSAEPWVRVGVRVAVVPGTLQIAHISDMRSLRDWAGMVTLRSQNKCLAIFQSLSLGGLSWGFELWSFALQLRCDYSNQMSGNWKNSWPFKNH